ncbi:MAG: SDR family oxidoreductase [Phycisphaeraceae bacterium]|nr:SDR family oxidoreductase [Phycisphaeraceae bacterium]
MGAPLRVLVTGSTGFVGSHIASWLERRGHFVVRGVRAAAGASGNGVVAYDLADAGSLRRAVASSRLDAVVHCAAMPDIRACERDPVLARLVNTEATRSIAEACAATGARMIFFSTDQVFDGRSAPYTETDQPRPLHVYGQTKLEGEAAVLGSGANAVVLRLALCLGRSPSGRKSASDQVVGNLAGGQRMELFTDEVRSPIHVSDVAGAVAELLTIENPPRLLHLGGPVAASRYEIGLGIARAHGLDASPIVPMRQSDVSLAPPRPRDLTFDIQLALRTLRTAPAPWTDRLAET